MTDEEAALIGALPVESVREMIADLLPELDAYRARLAEVERERDEARRDQTLAIDHLMLMHDNHLGRVVIERNTIEVERDVALQRAAAAEARLAELIQIGDDVAHASSDWSDGDDDALDRVDAKHGDRREVLRVETIRDAVSKAEQATISAIAHWVRKERHVEPLVTNYLADCIENGAWRSKEKS